MVHFSTDLNSEIFHSSRSQVCNSSGQWHVGSTARASGYQILITGLKVLLISLHFQMGFMFPAPHNATGPFSSVKLSKALPKSLMVILPIELCSICSAMCNSQEKLRCQHYRKGFEKQVEENFMKIGWRAYLLPEWSPREGLYTPTKWRCW